MERSISDPYGRDHATRPWHVRGTHGKSARKPSIFNLWDGAGGGGRTHTPSEGRWILSPVRLPVPPLRPGGCAAKLYYIRLYSCFLMALFKTRSAAVYGIDAHLIDVEVDMFAGN